MTTIAEVTPMTKPTAHGDRSWAHVSITPPHPELGPLEFDVHGFHTPAGTQVAPAGVVLFAFVGVDRDFQFDCVDQAAREMGTESIHLTGRELTHDTVRTFTGRIIDSPGQCAFVETVYPDGAA